MGKWPMKDSWRSESARRWQKPALSITPADSMLPRWNASAVVELGCPEPLASRCFGRNAPVGGRGPRGVGEESGASPHAAPRGAGGGRPCGPARCSALPPPPPAAARVSARCGLAAAPRRPAAGLPPRARARARAPISAVASSTSAASRSNARRSMAGRCLGGGGAKGAGQCGRPNAHSARPRAAQRRARGGSSGARAACAPRRAAPLPLPAHAPRAAPRAAPCATRWASPRLERRGEGATNPLRACSGQDNPCGARAGSQGAARAARRVPRAPPAPAGVWPLPPGATTRGWRAPRALRRAWRWRGVRWSREEGWVGGKGEAVRSARGGKEKGEKTATKLSGRAGGCGA
jgi:hypothetical protein